VTNGSFTYGKHAAKREFELLVSSGGTPLLRERFRISQLKRLLMPTKWMAAAIGLAMVLLTNVAGLAGGEGWKQSEFLITFWCPPPVWDPALSAVAAEHYNMTWTPVEGLDTVAKNHLRLGGTDE
jgi:hypothetical protein